MSAVQHHGSHRGLLSRIRPDRNRHAPVNAIVVPSARPAAAVTHAAHLAKTLASPLIVLASKQACAKEIVTELAPLSLDRLHVVDFPEAMPQPFPKLQASKVLEREGLSRKTDVSVKRNVALAVCRMAGLHSVVFLDDDMVIPQFTDLTAAAGLLAEHEAVGLRLEGFPDNSVVCHANRETGGFQDTFVGGGALVVATNRITSIFPDIYNEDWFFLLDGSAMRRVTVTGRAIQRPYDPFASADRARAEEFGDVLAEGIFAILDAGRVIADADRKYWRAFIKRRRWLIEGTLRKATAMPKAMRNGRMIRSLLVARDQLITKVTPDLCVEYLRSWQQDLDDWKIFCEDLPTELSIPEALDHFGLTGAPVIDAMEFVAVAAPLPTSTPEPIGGRIRALATAALVALALSFAFARIGPGIAGQVPTLKVWLKFRFGTRN